MSEQLSRELVIKVIRDDAEARRQAAAYWEAEAKGRDRAASADKARGDAAKAAEKAKADAAKDADRLIAQIEKEAEARRKAEAKERVARAKETNQAVRQADKVMSDLVLADLKAIQAADAALAKARKESAAEVARVVRQAEVQAAADRRQWDRRELTDEEVQQRGISGLIRKANKDRVQAFIDSHRQEKGLLGDLKSAWDSKVGAITAAGPAVAGLTVAMSGLKIGSDVIGVLDEKMRYFAESTRESTKALIAQHKQMLELAGFAGTPGETGPQMFASTALAAVSGLSISEATEVRKAAEASAFSLVDKAAIPAQNGMPAVEAQQGRVPRSVYDKAIEMAAKLAAVSGGDPGDYGRGVGTVINLEGRRIDDVGVIEDRLLQNERLATLAGFETTAGLFDQVDRNLPLVKSGVIAGPELSALTALYAESSPSEANTFTRQAINAVSAGLLQARGMKIDEEFAADASTTSEYFKSIGITQQDDVMPRLFKVADDIRAQQAKAQAAGRTFNANEFLMSRGFGNEHSRTALMAFAGQQDKFRDLYLPTISKDYESGTIDAQHSNFVKNTMLGRARSMGVMGEAATAIEGTKFGDLNNAIEAQYNILKAKGEAAGPLSEYMEPLGRGPFDIYSNIKRAIKGTTPNALLGPVAESLQDALRASGQSIGAFGHTDRLGNIAATISDVMTSGARSWEEKGAVFREGVGQVQAAGGDPSLGLGEKLDTLIEVMRSIHRTVGGVEQNTKPDTRPRPVPPAPGRPQAPSNKAL